jgi:hypothetical protein
LGVIIWLKDLKLLSRRGRGKKRCNRNREIRRLAAWKLNSVRPIVYRDSVMRILTLPASDPARSLFPISGIGPVGMMGSVDAPPTLAARKKNYFLSVISGFARNY